MPGLTIITGLTKAIQNTGLTMPTGLTLTGSNAPFVPTDIANLALWLDASDASTITQAGGLVSQWNDKSGNARNATQAIGANQPVTGTRTIGGLNAIDFDGLTDFMTLASALDRTNGYTFFSVSAFDDTLTTKSLIGGAAAGCFVVRANSTENVQVVRQGQAVLLTGATALTAGTGYILTAQSSVAGNSIRLNGVSDGSNATDSAYTTNSGIIGAENNGLANMMDGPIGSLMVWTRILTIAERNLVGNYLAAKWGISWTNI